jgi:sugar/nucleoside kinase (ribokinase family)
VTASLDYLAIGHVTLDRQPDGTALPGGTVLFAALQAARLGLRAGILTGGRPEDLDAALAPYRAEAAIDLRPAPATTTFTNVGVGAARRQTVHGWAGPLALPPALPPARIVHLAPVARELDLAAPPPCPAGVLLGVTPQGWLRRWGADGRVTEHPLRLPEALVARLDALALSETEAPLAGAAIAAIRARGGLVAVTRGLAGCTLLGPAWERDVPALDVPLVDDTGAGDIFAAAWFVALAEGREPVAAARDAIERALRVGARAEDN